MAESHRMVMWEVGHYGFIFLAEFVSISDPIEQIFLASIRTSRLHFISHTIEFTIPQFLISMYFFSKINNHVFTSYIITVSRL